MTAEEFDRLLDERIELMVNSLTIKASEYATGDRLHNFKEAAATFNVLPAEVCWSYMMKHLVSIKDMAEGVRAAPPEVVREKIGDAINYLVLIEALFREGTATERTVKVAGEIRLERDA